MPPVVRNRAGRAATTVSASEVKQQFGALLELVQRDGAVSVLKHNKVVAIILSPDVHQALSPSPEDSLGALSKEFDAAYARMQQPAMAAAMEKVFAMTPKELGAAAVKRAGKTRGGSALPKRIAAKSVRRRA